MLNNIWAIIAGLIIGPLAKLVVPGRQATALADHRLGIAGALIAIVAPMWVRRGTGRGL